MANYRLYGLRVVDLGDRKGVWQIDRIDTYENAEPLDKDNLIFAAGGYLDSGKYSICLVCQPAVFGHIKDGVLLCNMAVESVTDLPIDMASGEALTGIIRADYEVIRTAAQKGVV